MMKIPDNIRINGIDFTVEMQDDLNNGTQVMYGDVDYGLSRIRLNPSNQNHQRLCATLWHEILHAVCEMNNLELGEKEENIIDAFSFAIYQVLQDNGGKLFDLAKLE